MKDKPQTTPRERWKRFYRQLRIGRWEVMGTSLIEGPDWTIEIYGKAKSVWQTMRITAS